LWNTTDNSVKIELNSTLSSSRSTYLFATSTWQRMWEVGPEGRLATTHIPTNVTVATASVSVTTTTTTCTVTAATTTITTSTTTPFSTITTTTTKCTVELYFHWIVSCISQFLKNPILMINERKLLLTMY
jgi:hypothetical protein